MDTTGQVEALPQSLAERLDILAAQLARPRTELVRDALEAWATREERYHAMTLEALADVDAGRLVDHAEIEAWAASLTADAPPSR